MNTGSKIGKEIYTIDGISHFSFYNISSMKMFLQQKHKLNMLQHFI